MTTIAYRNGIMAADTQVSTGDVNDCFITKLAKNKKGDIAGAGGPLGYKYKFLKWFKSGEKGKPPSCVDESAGFEGVIVRKSGKIEIYDQEVKSTIRCNYYAFGSGNHLALGAMANGATAKQAVKAAIKHDVYSGGKITKLKLKG